MAAEKQQEYIEIRGARRTQEGLIRRRLALEEGGLYRRSLVRRTEEQLATLGVFALLSVAGVPLNPYRITGSVDGSNRNNIGRLASEGNCRASIFSRTSTPA